VTDDKLILAKGATRYDLVEMPDEEFESMCARLIRLEFPAAFKPADTFDGGADMALANDDGGYIRCWQSKRFRSNVPWTKCKKSFAAACTNWNPEHYTFCFPRELTIGEQKTFDKHFRRPATDIKVDYWNGEELQARLNGSDEGQRVARTFFDDVALDRENTYRAIEAGGRLDTPMDALDRLSNIGGFLAGKDAYFSYPSATHEAEGPSPPVTPGSVMSVGTIDRDVASRIDMVPRDEEAMERYGPRFVLQPTDSEEGMRAAERLQQALREGQAVEIEEGLDVTFTQMPPGFEDVVGQRMVGGTVQIGPARLVRPEAPPWKTRMRATTDAGTASLDVYLQQADVVPAGWDDEFAGRYGGLDVTGRFRRRGTGGELRWTLRYSRDDSPIREQVAALQFVKATCGTGELVLSDVGNTGRPELRLPTEPGDFLAESLALLTFLEDVRAIEEWADVEYVLPPKVSASEARDIAHIAHIVRNRGRSIRWKHVEMTVRRPAVQPLRDGRLLRIEMKARATILGRVVALGYSRLEIADYNVATVQPAAGQPDTFHVRVEPAEGDDAPIVEQLVKHRTPTTKRPPSPPRKGKRNRGRKGGKRKRR
jgi:hypothetical protein